MCPSFLLVNQSVGATQLLPVHGAENDIDFQHERRRSNETPHNTPVCIVPWNEPNRPVQPRAEGEVDSRSRPVKPTLRVILVRPSLSPTRHARPVKLHGVVINDFNPRSRISMYLVVTTSSYSTDVAQSLSVC